MHVQPPALPTASAQPTNAPAATDLVTPAAHRLDLSIIIPVASDARGLETTLRSLQAMDVENVSYEIIVCNDGGGDPISRIAARYQCLEVRLERNRGSYAARNAGASVARGGAFAFVDADQTVASDWAQRGLESLREADYVGGRIVVALSEFGSYWQRVDSRYAFPVARYIEAMRFAPTANLFVARDAFENTGGFEGTLRSGGDREFGVRCFRSGISQRFDPSVKVTHPARGFWAQLSKAKRTAAGTALLEVCFWSTPPSKVAMKALVMHMARLYRAARLSIDCIHARSRGKEAADPCLGVGRALIESRYHLAVATSAVRLWFSRKLDPKGAAASMRYGRG